MSIRWLGRLLGEQPVDRLACLGQGGGGGFPLLASCGSDDALFSRGVPVFQLTLVGAGFRTFGYPGGYEGTSMAAAHVSGAAAMVLASGVLGKQPSPKARVNAVTRRLRATARDLGLPRTQEGAGLIDAGAATDPEVQ